MLKSFAKKLGRSIQFSEIAVLATMSKVLPTDWAKKATRKLYADKLIDLRGVPMKIGQILSFSEKQDGDQLFKESIDSVEPMSLEVLTSQLQKEASDWQQNIETISEKGIAASLGQVHQVRMKDGRDGALKIQYPGIDISMDLDQALMGLLVKSFDSFKEGFDLKDYESIIKEELLQELDYKKEVETQEYLFALFKDYPEIVIPKPYPQESGEHHILMQWEDSINIHEFLKVASKADKMKAGSHLVRFFFHMIYQGACVHADPNPGNFGFRGTGDHLQLVVYDFGSVVSMSKEKSLSLFKIMGCAQRGEGDLRPWLKNLGFNVELLSHMNSRLLAFFDLLFEPFLAQGRYDLKNWNRKERAKDILGEDRWNFMLAAPADFLGFMRFVQGFFYYIDQLDEGVFIKPFIEEYIIKYRSSLDKMFAPVIKEEEPDFIMARHLQIRVVEEGVTKVNLKFPRTSIESLEDIMDDDLTERLKSQGITIQDVVKKARETSYIPMDLFKINKPNKEITVSLVL